MNLEDNLDKIKDILEKSLKENRDVSYTKWYRSIERAYKGIKKAIKELEEYSKDG